MRKWSRYLAGVVAVMGLCVLAAAAGGETCTLKMKRVDTSSRPDSTGLPADYMFRSTYPQSFFKQLGGPDGLVIGPQGGETPAFSEVIKKEPEHASATPFRGVAQLGSYHYGFVLDAAPPKEKEATKDEAAGKAEKEEGQGSLFSMLSQALTGRAAKEAEKPAADAVAYARLFFDLNHNGDLTDDKVVEAEAARVYGSSSRSTFPVTAVTIDVDGKKVDYAFTFSVYSAASRSLSYASASLNAAAYREGEITLDGKKRRVVLVDFNSNGRFDDAAGIRDDIRTSDGSIYPRMGDMLYIDPQPAQGYRNPYDSTSSKDQYQVGKLVNYGGRFFDLEIDPSGDRLTLEPSAVPVGYVTNPNKGYRAVVYGDQGLLDIADDESGKAALPEGRWKLLSYTISRQEAEPEKADEAGGDDQQKSSLLETLASVFASARPTVSRLSTVSARAKADYPAVAVVRDKTVEMPFGPPYRPLVTAQRSSSDSLSLGMSLVGTGGEVCSNLTVNGSRPPQPEFTVKTSGGEEVASGKFSYG